MMSGLGVGRFADPVVTPAVAVLGEGGGGPAGEVGITGPRDQADRVGERGILGFLSSRSETFSQGKVGGAQGSGAEHESRGLAAEWRGARLPVERGRLRAVRVGRCRH